MIIQEPYGDNLIRTYSDVGKYIIQNETGVKYAEAIDIPYKYTYRESDEDIEPLNRFLYEETDDLSDKALKELGGIGDDTNSI